MKFALVWWDLITGLTVCITISYMQKSSFYFCTGIVTRSRTGRTKPKTLDEDDYEVPTSKRRSAAGQADSPVVKKKMRLETQPQDTYVIDISKEVETGVGDSELIVSHGASKKTVSFFH